ncbi:hypothetical protein ACWDRB_55225 [Nonomuraea sp. NPDC003707]
MHGLVGRRVAKRNRRCLALTLGQVRHVHRVRNLWPDKPGTAPMEQTGPDIGPAFPPNNGARTIMPTPHEFILLAVAVLNLITAVVGQRPRPTHRRSPRDRRPDANQSNPAP